MAAACWGGGLLSLAGLGWAVCPSGRCGVPAPDARLLELAYHARAPLPDAVFHALTWLGSVALLLPLALAVAGWCWRTGRRRAAVLLPLTLIGARVLAHAAKTLFERARPDAFPVLGPAQHDAAFPSAHAMQAAAMAVALLFAFGRERDWRAWSVAVCLVLLVGASRVWLQVHFPSDVLAGTLAGAAWAAGLWWLAGRTR